MSFRPEFLMRIAKVAHSSEEGSGITSIIIRQPYAHLEKELRSAFKGKRMSRSSWTGAMASGGRDDKLFQ